MKPFQINIDIKTHLNELTWKVKSNPKLETTKHMKTCINFIINAADSVAVGEVTKLTDVGFNFGQVKISSFSPSWWIETLLSCITW